MKKIVVTGSLAYDYIMDYPGVFTEHINPAAIHNINVSFLINKLQKSLGGTAGNIVYNLSLLDTPSSVLGAVGKDFEEYKIALKKYRVGTQNIKVIKDEFTSQAYVMTDQKTIKFLRFTQER